MNREEYLQVMTQSFERRYASGADVWTGEAELTRGATLLLEHLPARRRRRILDVGTGRGRDVERFLEAGHVVTGVDLHEDASWERIRRAWGRRVAFSRAVFPWWTPPDGLPFDAVLDSGCLHHQHPDDYPAYLGRVVQLMRPGALFVLAVFATADGSAERGRTSAIDGGRLCRQYAEPELRQELGRAGLSPVAAERVPRTLFAGCYLVVVAKRD